MKSKHLLSYMSVALALAVSFSQLQAQEKQPLKIMIGFPAGGSADTMARVIGDALRDDFSSVIVESKPGASGRIALAAVKNAKPDGQTVLVTPSGPMVIFPHVYKKLDYDPVKSFTPISLMTRLQFAVVSGPAGNVKTVAEMLAKAKADPKNATYGSSGLGTLPHFLGVLLEQSSGVPLMHVPFQGGAPANTALLGGHIAYNFDVVSEALELHRSGKVRVIAVSGSKRDAQLPDVPTLKEAGVDIEANVWFAMYGPAGMPPEVTAKIGRAVNAALKKPATQALLLKQGMEPVGTTSTELAAIQKADLARWEKPIKATGVALD